MIKNIIYIYNSKKIHSAKKVSSDCFGIIDRASSYFRLQFEEAMHINWKKSEINKQVKHVSITISM